MTDHVPAAAEGMPKITRRTALAGASAGLLAGTATLAVAWSPTEAPAAVLDPMLEALRTYSAQLAAFNRTKGLSDEESNHLMNTTWGAFWSRIGEGRDVPEVTTEAGAIECIRVAIAERNLGPFEGHVLAAALAYLEGRA